MGTRGPIPARDSELARPRSRNGRDAPETTRGTSRKPTIPRADSAWHPIAKTLYDSLKKSGQSDYYQQSDWAFAYSLCEDLSHYKNQTRRSGQMLASIYSAMERLLVSEGDRRRVRIELTEPPSDEQSAAVLAIADYQKELGISD